MNVYAPPCECGLRTQRAQVACTNILSHCQSRLLALSPVERAARYIVATAPGETLTFVDLSEDQILAAFARASELRAAP